MYTKDLILKELHFNAIRSSGSGGQHVNKVSSKIELSFNVYESAAFSEDLKARIILKIQKKLNKEGVLILYCDQSRSQHKNKALCIEKLFQIIDAALIVPKPRIPTKIPKSLIKKRLKSKKHTANTKVNRKKPDVDF